MHKLTVINLQAFCCIAQLGSFTAAAERLNITQPAISKRVKDLEEAVGSRLFRRQGRRMELTVQGRALVQRAEPLLNRLGELVISLESPAAATGIIRIGVGEIVAVTWLGELMAHLKRRMPGINYEIEVGLTVNMQHRLEIGELDVAIFAAIIHSSQLTTTHLGRDRLHWLISEKLLRDEKTRNSSVKEILEKYPVWCVARPSHMYPLAIEVLRRYEVAPSNINTSDSVQSIVEMVKNSVGIAVLPESLVAGEIKNGSLMPLSAELASTTLDFVIAHHREQNQGVIQQIVECAVETSQFEFQ